MITSSLKQLRQARQEAESAIGKALVDFANRTGLVPTITVSTSVTEDEAGTTHFINQTVRVGVDLP